MIYALYHISQNFFDAYIYSLDYSSACKITLFLKYFTQVASTYELTHTKHTSLVNSIRLFQILEYQIPPPLVIRNTDANILETKRAVRDLLVAIRLEFRCRFQFRKDKNATKFGPNKTIKEPSENSYRRPRPSEFCTFYFVSFRPYLH